MRLSADQAAGVAQLRRKLLKHMGEGPRRISTYRMFKSREFRELCAFYLEGIGIRRFEQFADYALRLEETFFRADAAE